MSRQNYDTDRAWRAQIRRADRLADLSTLGGELPARPVKADRPPVCSQCCQAGRLYKGICVDRIACQERMPPMFDAEAME